MHKAFYKNNLHVSFSRFLLDYYFTLGDKIFDAVAICSIDKFKKDFHKKHKEAYQEKIGSRPFLFSKKCVSYEIKVHCLVEWIATGVMTVSLTNITLVTYLAASAYLKSHTSVIEIVEQDVLKKRDSKLFDYFTGIAKCYKKTSADPYWNGKKRDKNYLKPGWENNIIPYGSSK